MAFENMEIADSQPHPIDLSRKRRYYEKPHQLPIYAKPSPCPAVSSSRPLPGLIPISSLKSSKTNVCNRSPFNDLATRDCSQFGFSPKESSAVRKELSRQRSMPHLAAVSRMQKSNSDPRLPFHSIGSPPGQLSFSDYLHHNNNTRSGGIRTKYTERRVFPDSSCLTTAKRIDDFRYGGDKNVKQGPGVSFSTIQSLRKLLDKRKSMKKES